MSSPTLDKPLASSENITCSSQVARGKITVPSIEPEIGAKEIIQGNIFSCK